MRDTTVEQRLENVEKRLSKLEEKIDLLLSQFKLFGNPPRVIIAFFMGTTASLIGIYYIVQQIVHIFRP